MTRREMYADGAAEVLIGEAIANRRDDIFLVSKVLPHHATRRRWCRVSISDLERHQLTLLRAELGLDPPPGNTDNRKTNRQRT